MDPQKTEILLTVYRAHKEELMSRRKMEYLTMTLCLVVFLAAAVGALYAPVLLRHPVCVGLKFLATIVVILLADIIIYQQVKNYNRICEMQRAIVSIDAALGLFTAGTYTEGAIYPEEWRKSGTKRPWGSPSRVVAVAVFAFVAVLALWIR